MKKLFALLFCLLFPLSAAFTMTLVNQTEDQVAANTFRDDNGNGLEDGDVVLLRRFRSETDRNSRITLTVMVEDFLTSKNTDLKHEMQPGDIIVLHNSTLNPFSHTIDQQRIVAFLKRIGNEYIVMSMKAAPVHAEYDASGSETLKVLNPWQPSGGTPSNLAQSSQVAGTLTEEDFGLFSARIRNR